LAAVKEVLSMERSYTHHVGQLTVRCRRARWRLCPADGRQFLRRRDSAARPKLAHYHAESANDVTWKR